MRKQSSAKNVMGCLMVVAFAALSSGCLDRELKPLNPCLVSGVTAKIAVNNVDKVDLLFMVDNSNSMHEEQSALSEQFPKLITVLTSGMRSPTDTMPFPPAKDLHLGVVTSDMGLVGVNDVTGCTGFGADGIMFDPTERMCNGGIAGQRFLSYKAGDDAAALATNFGCLATLGTGGCGYEQQLEAVLKGLWPKVDVNIKTQEPIVPNRISFLHITPGDHEFGHGDQENKGFMRNNPTEGLSLLAMVVVTDEEDCSSKDTAYLKRVPMPGQIGYGEALNLRCFKHKDHQYETGTEMMVDGKTVRSGRYLPAFKALREGNEQLVIYAAIVGVPPGLVTPEKRKGVDFSKKESRDAYYDGILSDPAMQEVEVQQPASDPLQWKLRESCNTNSGVAYPPRRMVELAKAFGENAVVQSICNCVPLGDPNCHADFGPAMDAIIEVIAKQLGAVCLPKPLTRKADGKVSCNVVWELPKPNTAPATTPVDCSQKPFLSPVDADHQPMNENGGKNCTVLQLPTDASAKLIKPDPDSGKTDGWYYDDFSDQLAKECSPSTPHRVAFSPNAKPPTGVTVKLECLDENQQLKTNSNREDVNLSAVIPGTNKVAEIGTPCSGVKDAMGMPVAGDKVCSITLTSGMLDTSMFCHPDLNVCVKKCSSDSDCPSAWTCDDRPTTTMTSGGKPYCVNPTCGSSSDKN